MKKLITISILLVSLSSLAHAEWRLEPRLNFFSYESSTLTPDYAQELRIHKDWFFVTLGKERVGHNPANLNAQPIELDSYGIGVAHEFLEGLAGSIAVAYFDPTGDGEMFWDAGYYHMNKRWSWIHGTQAWKSYDVVLDKAIGVTLGLDYKRKLWKMIDFGVGISYRYLKIHETYQSYIADGSVAFVYTEDADWGAVGGSVFLSIPF